MLTSFTQIAVGLRAQEEPEAEELPAKQKPNKQEMVGAAQIEQGDKFAVAGEREEALSLWSHALAQGGSGTRTGEEALARLDWACRESGSGGWGPSLPGLAFARSRRDHFLGLQESSRRAQVHEFYANHESQPELQAYTRWLLHHLNSNQAIELLPLVLEDGLDEQPQWLAQALNFTSSREFLREPTRIIRAMQLLGFLEGAKTFRSCLLSEDGRSTTLTQMMGALRKMNSEGESRKTYEAVSKYLKELKPRTFGADLTLALLETDAEKSLSGFITTNAAEIKRMTNSRRDEVLNVIKWSIKGYPNADDMDDSVVAALKPLLANNELQTLESQLAELLSAKKWGQDDIDEYKHAITAASMISATAARHLDRAEAGLRQAVALLKSSPAQGNKDQPPSNRPVAYLLQYLAKEPALFPLAMETADKGNILEDHEWIGNFVEENKVDQLTSLIEFFRKGGFIAEVEDFQPLAYKDTDITNQIVRSYTLLSDILRRNKSNEAKVKLQEYLESKPQTFGVDITQLMLNSNAQTFAEFLHRRSHDFNKVPPERRGAIYDILLSSMMSFGDVDNLSEDIQKMLSPLHKSEDDLAEKFYSRIMKVESLASINLSYKSGCSDAIGVIDRIAQFDPAKALALADKVVALVRASPDEGDENLHRWIQSTAGDFEHMVAAVPELFPLVMHRRDDLNSPRAGNFHAPILPRIRINNPTKVVKFLEDVGCLEEAPGFRDYRSASPLNWATMLSGLLRDIHEKPACEMQVKRELATRRQTFGVEFILALMERNEDAVLKFALRRRLDFAQLHPMMLQQVATLLGIMDGSWLQFSRISPAWREAMEPAAEVLKSRLEKSYTHLMEANKLSDLGPDDWLWNVANMIRIDRVKGAKAFEHLADLYKDKYKDQPPATDEDPNCNDYIHWLRYTIVHAPVLKIFKERAAKDGLRPNHLHYLLENFTHQSDTPLEFLVFIDEAGFLNEATDYDAGFTLPVMDSEPLLLNVFKYQINERGKSDSIKRLIQYLSGQPKKTFGADMILAVLDKNTARSVPEFIKRRAADFALLPESSRETVLVFLRKAWPKMPSVRSMPAELRDAMVPLLTREMLQGDHFAKDVLTARSLADVHKGDMESFMLRIRSLINELVVQDRDLAVKLFIKSWSFHEPSPNTSYGRDFYTGMLLEESKKFADSCPTLERLSFIHGLFMEISDGKLSYSESYKDYKQDSIIFDEWRRLGGEAFPGKAMDKVLRHLAFSMRGMPPTLLALDFHRFFKRLPQRDRVDLVTWAESQPDVQEASNLVRELAVAGRLFLEYEPQANVNRKNWACAFKRLPEHDALWNHYLKAIKDEQLNPQVRVALAEHLCMVYPEVVPPDVVRLGLKAFFDPRNKFKGAIGDNFATLLRAFSDLPVNALWTETYENLMRMMDAGYDHEGWLLYDAVHLFAVKSGNEEWLENIKKKQLSPANINSKDWRFDLFPALAAAGRADLARDVIGVGENLYLSTLPHIELFHPEQFQTALKAMRHEYVNNEALAQLAEFRLIPQQDPPSAVTAAIPSYVSRSQRLSNLCDRLIKSPSMDSASRIGLANMLTKAMPALSLKLDSLLLPESKKIDLKTVSGMFDFNQFYSDKNNLLPILVQRSAKDLSSGDASYVLEFHSSMMAANQNNAYHFTEVFRPFSEQLSGRIMAYWSIGEGRNPAPYLEYSRAIFTESAKFNEDHFGITAAMALVLIALNDGKTNEWCESVPEGIRKQVRGRLSRNIKVWDFAAALAGEGASRLPLEQRLRIILNLLRTPWVQVSSAKSNVVDLIVNRYHILDCAEVVAHAGELAGSWPRDGRNAAELAEICYQNDDFSGSVTFLKLAAGQSQKTPSTQADYSLRLGALLTRLGQIDEARAVQENIANFELDDQQSKLRDALK